MTSSLVYMVDMWISSRGISILVKVFIIIEYVETVTMSVVVFLSVII